ncbi:RNA polymerase Rpc34 [Pyronema omphalodes]|nr:RNA polymerase Rpc34 [Pyronema omphalodes]
MAEVPHATIQEFASDVYEQCLQAPSGYLFTIQELTDMTPGKANIEVTSKVLNELLRDRRIQAMTQGTQNVFRVVSKEMIEKVKNMNADEEMLYSYIQDAAREGIWTKTLKAKSNMHNTTMSKCLKTLENKRYIKAIQSVKYPTRKIYMLYELTPSIEVSGGPWFTDRELDHEFINELSTAMLKFIASKSIPRARAKDSTAPVATTYPPNFTGYPTLNQIYLWVKNSNLTEVDLAEADIKALLDVLVYDGKIERVVGGTAYRALRKHESVNGFTESPCGRCPVFQLCREGGPVSASNCKYFEEWLEVGL